MRKDCSTHSTVFWYLGFLGLLVFALSARAVAQGIGPIQGDIAAPDVVVRTPDQRVVTVNNPVFVMRVLILSPLYPLTEATIVVNGKTEKRILSGSRFALEENVTLQLGTNTVTIGAANRKASSKPITRTIVYERPALARSRLILLAIGVSQFKDGRASLKFASNDAETLARALTSNPNQPGPFQTIIPPRILLDSKATRAGIIEGLDWLNASATFDDDVRVLILSGLVGSRYFDEPYFFSHEHQTKGDPELYDIRLTSFWEKLAGGPGRTVIFVNSELTSGPDWHRFTERVRRVSLGRKLVTFLATREDELPIVPSDEWGHSAFTKALLEGLSGNAELETDGRKDGTIDSDELQIWVQKRVAELSRGRQHPTSFAGVKAQPLFKYR